MAEESKLREAGWDVSFKTSGLAFDKTGGVDRVDFVQQTESLPRQNEFPCVQ
jgi:hypothetical protein